MRILHILDHSAPLLSGYAYRTLSILREQQSLGWHTEQLTGPKHATQVLDEDTHGFRFHRTPAPRGFGSTLPLLRHLALVAALQARILALASKLRPALLHAHSPALNALAALRAGRCLGLPVVYEVRAFWEDAAVDHGTSREHGPRYRLSRALETHVLRRVDAVTVICTGLKGELLARGIPGHKVTVVSNAVDVERFPTIRHHDPEISRRLGLQGSRVLGFLGSFYAYEGLDLLLDALPALLQRNPSVRTLLVGEGPREGALRKRVHQLGLDGKVVFAGRVAYADVRRYYDLVDILVYPRLSMRLTEIVTPLKPLEAMAMGKLVVASGVGGHRELLEDGKTGLLFKPGNKEDLLRTLSRALDEPALVSNITRNARRFVEEERTWTRTVSAYAPIYERLVHTRERQPLSTGPH